MTKSCSQCNQAFDITDSDLAFYDKVSPVFGEKKFLIPPPTLCPECRLQRRLAWRNERKLYNDSCDLCGKEIISLYSADNPAKVYCQSCWWGDSWDPLAYGRDIDPDRSFFDQYKELQKAVPRLAIFNLQSTNSEYTNHSSGNKNCYLGVAMGDCEDCLYSHWIVRCVKCMDCLYSEDCQYCYECAYCEKCYGSSFSQYCRDLTDSAFCYDCRDCRDCLGCTQLQHKRYMVLNRQVSEEEYRRIYQQVFSSFESLHAFRRQFEALKAGIPQRAAWMMNLEECSGNNLHRSKKAIHCFDCYELQDCKYMYSLGNNKDSMDCYEHGWLVPSELNYECHGGMAGYHLLFSSVCADSRDLMYCDLCFNGSENLWGCVGLRHKRYCILNKQYAKEEYEATMQTLISAMRERGEWGEFFPLRCSPFFYNETAAQDHFPLTAEGASRIGAAWKKTDASNLYQGTRVILPSRIADVTDDITKQILLCDQCGKNYKVISQELRFYRERNIPVPRVCFNCRHLERMKARNPWKLFSRLCDKCGASIQSTYAPDRPERVFCEECYVKEVY